MGFNKLANPDTRLEMKDDFLYCVFTPHPGVDFDSYFWESAMMFMLKHIRSVYAGCYHILDVYECEGLVTLTASRSATTTRKALDKYLKKKKNGSET